METFEQLNINLCAFYDPISGLYGVNTGLAMKLEFYVASYVRTQALHTLICIIQQALLFCYKLKMEDATDIAHHLHSVSCPS